MCCGYEVGSDGKLMTRCRNVEENLHEPANMKLARKKKALTVVKVTKPSRYLEEITRRLSETAANANILCLPAFTSVEDSPRSD